MRTFIACLLVFFSTAALAKPPIEAYGELPDIRALSFSPDPSRFAFFKHQDDKELMVVVENGKGIIGTLDVTETKPRGLNFITNKHVVIFASHATKLWGGFEDSQASVYNLETGELMHLAEKEQRFRFYLATVGGDLTPAEKPNEAYFTALAGEKGDIPRSVLLRGNLDTGRAELISKGSPYSEDWLITRDGIVMAREDFNDKTNLHEIYTAKDGGWKLVFQEQTELPTISVVGYLPDRSGLLVWRDSENEKTQTLHKLSFDGTLSEPLYGTGEREPLSVYRDEWGAVTGIRYAGLNPTYFFLDPESNDIVRQIQSLFPADTVSISDFTDGNNKIAFTVSGATKAPAYYLFDQTNNAIGKVVPKYLRIDDADIAPVETITYKARDGLDIPSLLTHPKSAGAGSRLPLIVYPHGGPEAYSRLGFSYLAQYFANRGYLVLQPNFRGSAGFGTKHRSAGYGEWGRKMQDDITDGAKYLINSGWADPERVCIIGASYGGYAALAGGAFTPDLYQCVAAIAPVADIPKMLDNLAFFEGRNSSSLSYWGYWLGDRKENRDDMAAVSPVNSANNFTAPVLLLHGTADTVVPFDQSEAMNKALKAAGKNVRFVTLKDEDHWLSRSETRLQALKELDRFIRETIGSAE